MDKIIYTVKVLIMFFNIKLNLTLAIKDNNKELMDFTDFSEYIFS